MLDMDMVVMDMLDMDMVDISFLPNLVKFLL